MVRCLDRQAVHACAARVGDAIAAEFGSLTWTETGAEDDGEDGPAGAAAPTGN